MSGTIGQRLRAAAENLRGERVALREIATAHGPQAQATLLVLLAAPAALPVSGVAVLLAAGIAALAVAMWRGCEEAGLPARVAALELPRHRAQRVLRLLAACYACAGRVCRRRWTPLTDGRPARWLAALVALMAVLIVLPIPFGNVLPGLALVLLGLGLAFRDGVAVLAGTFTALAGTAFCVAAAAWMWSHGGDWLQRLLA